MPSIPTSQLNAGDTTPKLTRPSLLLAIQAVNNLYSFLDPDTDSTVLSVTRNVSITGTLNVSGTMTGTVSSSTKLSVARTINATGDISYTSAAFDGSANVTGVATLATVNSNPVTAAFVKSTINAKGLVTATTPVIASDITSLVSSVYVSKSGDTVTGLLTINAGATGGVFNVTTSYNSGTVQSTPTLLDASQIASINNTNATTANGAPTSDSRLLSFGGFINGNSYIRNANGANISLMSGTVNLLTLSSTGSSLVGPLTVTTAGVQSGIIALSGIAGNGTAIGIGRVGVDAQLAIAATGGAWLPGTAPGDLAIRTMSASSQILFGRGSTSTTMTLDGNSNVGINRTPGGDRLEVGGAISVFGTNSTSSASKFTIEENAGAARLLSYGPNTTTAGTYNFYQASSDNSVNRTAFFIDANGNMAMGSSAAVATGRLSVYTNGAACGVIISGNTTTSPSVGDINITRTGTQDSNVGKGALIQLGNTSSATYAGIQEYQGGLQFFGYASSVWSERMRLDSVGNITIGLGVASAPTLALQSTVTGKPALSVGAINVGSFVFENNFTGTTDNFGIPSACAGLATYPTSPQAIVVATSGLERMRVATNGDISFGSTSKFTSSGAVVNGAMVGYSFVSIYSNPTTYYLIATLPISTLGTFDQITIFANVTDNWSSNSNRLMKIQLANRGGLTARTLSLEGGTLTPAACIKTYTQSDGSVQVYVVMTTNYYATLSLDVRVSQQVTLVPTPVAITTTPAGTLSYDSGTAVPITTTDSTNNFFVGTQTTAPNTGVAISPGANSLIYVGHGSSAGNGISFAAFYYNSSLVGNIVQSGTTGTVYNTTSDYRLKEITGPVVDSGVFIDALKPKVGSWKSDGTKFVGFIAHEFQEVSPSSVTGTKDDVDEEGKPIHQSMQASSPEVMANIIAELQFLRARVAALEAQINK